MFKKIHAAIASTVLLAGLVAAPASAALAQINVSCSTSTTTTNQAGYVGCLGAYDKNMDKQLSDIYSALAADLGFSTNSYFASEDFADQGNPFTEYVGGVDTGYINFDVAQTGSFVIGLKQGSAFSLYLFNGANVAGGISGIAYDNLGVQKPSPGGNTLDLSHAGFFGSPVSSVPEADGYAMLLAGLGAIGFMARRRKAK